MPNGGLLGRRGPSPLRGITFNTGADPAAVYANRGIEQGIGALFQREEQQTRKAEFAAEQKLKERNAILGELGEVGKLLENKSIPKSLKLELYNSKFAPALESLRGNGPGSAQGASASVPRLTEWLDPLEDAIKAAGKVIYDDKLSFDDKARALLAIEAEAGNDVRLAPYRKQLEDQRVQQEERDERDMSDLLYNRSVRGGLSEAERVELYKMHKRSPNAFAKARTGLAAQGIAVEPIGAPTAAPAVPSTPQAAAAVPAQAPVQAPAAGPRVAGASQAEKIRAELNRLMSAQPAQLGLTPAVHNQQINQLQQELTRLETGTEREAAAKRHQETLTAPTREVQGLTTQEYGGVPFAQLPLEERRRIGKMAEEKELREARERGVGIAQAQREAELKLPLPADLKEYTGASTRGQAEAGGFVFDPKSPDVSKFRQQLAAGKDAFKRIDVVQKIVAETPAALGFTGQTASQIEGLRAQIANVMEFFKKENINISESEKSLKAVDRLFSTVGVTNRRLQAAIQHLVIRVAEAEGFTGRELTDRKLQLMEEIATGATQSPTAFNAVLDDLRRRTHDKVQLDSRSALGESGRPLLTEQQLRGRYTPGEPPTPPTVPARSGAAPAAPGEITILRRRPVQ